MATVVFYERPVPLDRDVHKDLRIAPLGNAAFAANTHSVPLIVSEFGVAARDYPIVFGGDSIDEIVPMAVLGLRASENLFVDAEEQWATDTYIPAFVRRYPFVLAEKPADQDGDDFTVCFDEAYAGFGNEKGERLFNEDGTESDVLKQTVAFLGDYNGGVKRTLQFTQRLRELDLLQSRTIDVKVDGKDLSLNGLFVVDEDKLRTLDKDVAGELLADGSLGWIYAHLLSLGNIYRVRQRLDVRLREDVGGKAEADAAPQTGKKKRATKSKGKGAAKG